MNKIYIQPEEYKSPRLILKASDKSCQQKEKTAVILKFKNIGFKEVMKESILLFETTYISDDGRYLIKQDFKKIPRNIEEEITVNIYCCKEHYEIESNNKVNRCKYFVF